MVEISTIFTIFAIFAVFTITFFAIAFFALITANFAIHLTKFQLIFKIRSLS